jgi:hypothetical protein
MDSLSHERGHELRTDISLPAARRVRTKAASFGRAPPISDLMLIFHEKTLHSTMTMTMTTQRPTSLLLLLALIFAQTVTGLPYFYVTSGRPKCVTAEIPKNTYVKIHFDAPGVYMLTACNDTVLLVVVSSCLSCVCKPLLTLSL